VYASLRLIINVCGTWYSGEKPAFPAGIVHDNSHYDQSVAEKFPEKYIPVNPNIPNFL